MTFSLNFLRSQAILIYASVLLPFALRLSYNAASPNRTSRFQGPLLPIVAFALSSLDALLVGSGVGVALPPLLALSHVIGSFTSTHGQHISLPKLPCATTAVYGSNLATILVAIFVLITCAHDGSIATHEYWWEPYASPQIRSLAKPALGVLSDVSPLVIIAPILAWGFKNVEHPTNTQESNRILHEYLAEDIAYGFERTWAYYRQTGLLSTMAYWFGLSMFYRSIFQDHTTPSQSAQYLVLVSLSVALSHIATVVADILAYQADDLDSEATAAIKRAPAGNPGIDDNPISLILLGLIAGPSLPLMLWLARGEEIRGWKGRRAWRTTVASKS